MSDCWKNSSFLFEKVNVIAMYFFYEYDFFLFLPEIFLLTAVLSFTLYGVIVSFFKTEKNEFFLSQGINSQFVEKKDSFQGVNTNQNNESIHLLMSHMAWLCSFSLFLTSILVWNMPIENGFAFFHNLVLDSNTSFSKLLLLGSSASCFLISIEYFKKEGINAFEYLVLMLLATLSMMLMVSSYDLLSLYLSIELQSLCFYVLAASKRDSEFSTEAGIKYFLLGAFASGIFLFGASLIYGFTGTTQFGYLTHLFTGFAENTFQNYAILGGILCVQIGFLFKLGAAPFHMWAPDVYEGAPTPITAFFSTVPKIAFLSVFLRFFILAFHETAHFWQPAILFASLLSMSIGAFAAFSQNKIKRLLAFSALGHIGYILMGTCCSTIEGIQSVYIYLFIYVCMTLCMFTFLLSVRGQNNTHLKSIYDLSILSTTNPLLAFTCTLCLFSLAGIPPLAGFCSKFYLFFAAISSQLYILAFIGILTSCISCFYYIRVIKIMYFEKPTFIHTYNTLSKEKAAILAITLFILVFFFLYPEPLFVHTHKLALLFVA